MPEMTRVSLKNGSVSMASATLSRSQMFRIASSSGDPV
ncbi:MAG: hypothetical protein GYA24_21350 [Candidatus Lokiarchaeota archaeon]|nr:hypothetical protein [Candidatus Lokiarchaeota archaeon]